MAINYGSDTYCLTDLQRVDQLVTDPRTLIAQRLFRMLQIRRGALGVIGDDASRGLDIRQYINAKLSPSDLSVAQQQIENECLKDEEVQSAPVSSSLVGSALTFNISVVTSVGPFTLTLPVDDLSSAQVFLP